MCAEEPGQDPQLPGPGTDREPGPDPIPAAAGGRCRCSAWSLQCPLSPVRARQRRRWRLCEGKVVPE